MTLEKIENCYCCFPFVYLLNFPLTFHCNDLVFSVIYDLIFNVASLILDFFFQIFNGTIRFLQNDVV